MSLSSAKMTLGYYSDTLQLGGSEVYLRQILEAIDRKRYAVKLFIPRRHPLYEFARGLGDIEIVLIDARTEGPAASLNDFSRSDSVDPARESVAKRALRSVVPSSLKLLIGTMKEIRRLQKIFEQDPVDLLHFNDTGCEPPVIAARRAGIKHIVGTYHVLPSDEQKGSSWVHRWIEHASVRCLTLGIAVSEATKTAWCRRTGIHPNRIRVIYNGIDLNQFKADAFYREDFLKEYGLPFDCRLICVPARLHPMKGHEVLFKAITENLQGMSNVLFLCVGDGPLENELKVLARSLGVDGRIRFMGFQKRLGEFMMASDLVVLPSIALEALPYVLIEAMACSKPIVASNFSGIPEIVKDEETGLLVPRKDRRALNAAIMRILNDRTLAARMGAAGRRRVEKLFTQERMRQETFKLYEELLYASPN